TPATQTCTTCPCTTLFRSRRTWENDKREKLSQEMLRQIDKVRAVAATLKNEPPAEVRYRGKTWRVGQPENLRPEQVYRWAHEAEDRKSTRLNSSHVKISYA